MHRSSISRRNDELSADSITSTGRTANCTTNRQQVQVSGVWPLWGSHTNSRIKWSKTKHLHFYYNYLIADGRLVAVTPSTSTFTVHHGAKTWRYKLAEKLYFLLAASRIHKVAQKNVAHPVYCKYFENALTELRGSIADTFLLTYALSSALMTPVAIARWWIF